MHKVECVKYMWIEITNRFYDRNYRHASMLVISVIKFIII